MQLRRNYSCTPQPMGELLPRCKLCEKVPLRGMMDGHFFSGIFVCRNCEDAIVSLEVGTDEYEHYIQQVKKLWE